MTKSYNYHEAVRMHPGKRIKFVWDCVGEPRYDVDGEYRWQMLTDSNGRMIASPFPLSLILHLLLRLFGMR